MQSLNEQGERLLEASKKTFKIIREDLKTPEEAMKFLELLVSGFIITHANDPDHALLLTDLINKQISEAVELGIAEGQVNVS